MSVAVSARWDAGQARAALGALAPRQWAFATALTLTRVGQHVKVAEQSTMQTSLDRPTPFTKNSLFLARATPAHLEARVWFKDFAPKGTPAGKYLMPQVHGGARRQKRFERHLSRAGLLTGGKVLVPASGAPLDSYGNVQRGMYSRILSQLHAQFDSAQNEGARGRKRARRRRTRGGRFFYGDPGHKGRGIWERFTFAFGSAVRPIFLEQTVASYRPRFAFLEVAERVMQARYGEEFDTAVDFTLRTAR